MKPFVELGAAASMVVSKESEIVEDIVAGCFDVLLGA